MTEAPKYAILVNDLRQLIQDLPVGSPVPSERALAERSGVSRMTARRALDTLGREGLVQRVVGKGSFVARPAVSLPLRLTGFSEDMRARGLTPSSQVLAQSIVPAGVLSEVFGVDPEETIVRLVRVRLADEVPIAIERCHLRAELVPGIEQLDLAQQPLYTVLERDYGIRLDTGWQSIRAGIVDPADATVLGVEEGSAVLEFVRTSAMGTRVVEHTVSIYPGSRFELSANIAPVTAGDRSHRSALRPRTVAEP